MKQASASIFPGCRVQLRYSLRLADGTVADATEDGPEVFVIGKGQLAEGLERHLIGLKAGDNGRFEIAAGEAFPLPDPEAVQTLARGDFDAAMELVPGHVIGFSLPSGEEVAGVVLAVGEEIVTVDFSHPLAGHDLVFEVEVVDVELPQ